jgi:phosphatidyl-myo-inositol alpha-mannosyltransferase
VRVALACPYAWDLPGGVQTHVKELAGQLRSRGHETLVLAPATKDPGEPGIRIVGRPIRIRYQGTVAPICFWPASIARIGSALRSFGPDVVHAHEPLSPSTAMFAAWRSLVPVVGTFHAYSSRSRLFDRAAPLLRPVWRKLSVRLAVSEAAAEFVGARMGDRVRVVPNGLDVDAFSKAEPAAGLPEGRRLLWVGRLDPQKGFPAAVKAFAELAGEIQDLSFVVVGEGADRRVVQALERETRGRIVMVGAVRHDQLPPYHAAADAFVSPAVDQESFGLVLVEAMAAGLPVVASDIPGYREVVRGGVDGLLVPTGDTAALTEALRRVLTDRDLATRLGSAGRERAARYRWDVVTQQIEAAYREAIAGHIGRGSKR